MRLHRVTVRGVRLRQVVVALLLLLFGCGPKVTVHPEYSERSTDTVALLPSSVPEGMQRERVAYFRDLLRLELENAGFLLLDEAIVRRVCATPVCAEKQRLLDTYEVNGFFLLEVASTQRVNFFAGYYNAVEGSLTFQDPAGQDLVSVEHTESSRGGVVFESGQVIQGIINQVRNSEGDAVNRLGPKFVRTLVSKIPQRMKKTQLSKAVEVSISQVETREVKPLVSEVCLQGTENGIAALLVNGQKATLRQTTPGRYCGIFRLEQGINNATVELRSPYGTSVRRSLQESRKRAGVSTVNQASVRAASFGR